MSQELKQDEVTKDGILIAKDCLTKFDVNNFKRRVIEVGSHTYPLNRYPFIDSPSILVIRSL